MEKLSKVKAKRTEVKTKYTPSVVLSDNFVNKVNFLHKQVKQNTEWSAILLYSTKEGSIDTDPNKWVISVDDCILMDIGTSAYTEYDMEAGDDYATEQWMDHLEAGGKIGHLHTHHNMACYFSGTDTAELHDNAPQHNYYLSLIVNYKNVEDWCAKVAVCGTETTVGKKETTKTWVGAKGPITQVDKQDLTQTEEMLYLMDCKLSLASDTKAPEGLQERIDSITAKKKEKAAKATYTSYNSNKWQSWNQPSLFSQQTPVKPSTVVYSDAGTDFDDDWNGHFDAFSYGIADRIEAAHLEEEKALDGEFYSTLCEPLLGQILGQTNEMYLNIHEVIMSIEEETDIVEIAKFMETVEADFAENCELYFGRNLTQLDLHAIAVSMYAILEPYTSLTCYDSLTTIIDEYLLFEDEFDAEEVKRLTGVPVSEQYCLERELK